MRWAIIAALACPSVSLSIRRALPKDIFPVAIRSGKVLQPQHAIIAEDPEGNRIGWAQLAPIGTALMDSSRYDSEPGSYDLQQDVDDQMWDEFENDKTVQAPSGWESLPWSPEYQAFAKSSQDRIQRRARIEKEAQKNQKLLFELSNLYVDEQFRGKGIGSKLLSQLLENQDNVYTVASDTSSAWLVRRGFRSTSAIPRQLTSKMAVGSVSASLINAADPICLVYSPK